MNTHTLVNTMTLFIALSFDLICRAMWEPSGSNGHNMVSLSNDNCIHHFDCGTHSPRVTYHISSHSFFSLIRIKCNVYYSKLISSGKLDAKGQPKFTACRWNVHQNYSQIATANDTAIRGWDLKSMKYSRSSSLVLSL